MADPVLLEGESLSMPIFSDPFLQDHLQQYVQPNDVLPDFSRNKSNRKRAKSESKPADKRGGEGRRASDPGQLNPTDLWNPANDCDILQRTLSQQANEGKKSPPKLNLTNQGSTPKVPITPLKPAAGTQAALRRATFPFFLKRHDSPANSSKSVTSSPSEAASFSGEEAIRRVPRVAMPPATQMKRKSSRLSQKHEDDYNGQEEWSGEQAESKAPPPPPAPVTVKMPEPALPPDHPQSIKCLPLYDHTLQQPGAPSHLASEQRRRALMKECYEQLHLILPTSEYRKPSKANLLQAAVRHLQRLELTLQRVVKETQVMRLNNVEMMKRLLEAGIELPDIPGYPIPPALIEQLQAEIRAGKDSRLQEEPPKGDDGAAATGQKRRAAVKS